MELGLDFGRGRVVKWRNFGRRLLKNLGLQIVIIDNSKLQITRISVILASMHQHYPSQNNDRNLPPFLTVPPDCLFGTSSPANNN